MNHGLYRGGVEKQGIRAMILLGLIWGGIVAFGKSGEDASKPAPTVVQIVVQGAITHPVHEIKAKMGTREGRPLSQQVLDEDFQRLFNMGTFADVQIKVEEVEGGVKVIVLLREKNVIRRIVFRGNKQVKTKRLMDLIKSKVGGRFDEGQANRDARAIEDWYKDEFYYFATVNFEKEPFEDGIRLVFNVDEGGRMYIRSITFRGNYSIPDKTLLKYMETKPGTWLTRGKFNRRTFEKDLERLRLLYQSRGYLDVKITERPFQITANTPQNRWERRDAHIYIDIEEGPQYIVGTVKFEGNKLVDDEALRKVIQTTPGEVFSPLVAQDDADLIRDIYGKYPSSRYFTKVRAERVLTERENIVDVVFYIEEGDEVIVEDVVILGNKKTKDHVFRREITVLPGEKIDSEKVNESKRNILNLGYTKPESTRIEVKEGSAPNRGKLIVDVEEAPTGKLSLGAGISSAETFVGTIELSQRNFDYADWPESFKDFITGNAFVGGGQKFQAKVSAGTSSRNYSLDWMNPWIFDRPIRWGFGVYSKLREWDLYDEKRVGGYTTIGRRLFIKNLDGSITYRIENLALTDFDEEKVSPLIANEKSDMTLSRLVFNLTYDTRDNVFDPTEGVRLSGTHENVGGIVGGDRDFWRQFWEANYFQPVFINKATRMNPERPWFWGTWYFGLRAELAAADRFGDTKAVPVAEKLYAGGIGTIRGFDFHSISPRNVGDEVGGLTRQTNTVEFFMPVYEKMIKLSAFYDVGGVWADTYSFEDDSAGYAEGGSGWRSSAGLGFHIKTPLGPVPIRLYWVHALDKEKGDDLESFQFTFGAVW